MTQKRLTKEDIRNSGVLNPIGHIIMGLADDAAAARAASALLADGFGAEDVLSYPAGEALQRLKARIESASQAAGFGYEITLMRRYLALAEEGCAFLIIYAPTDAAEKRVKNLAIKMAAKCAVSYGRLVNEDLI